ncbi:MAG: non-canonical purine NTP pyrophosphatase [Halobacteriota archaeon]
MSEIAFITRNRGKVEELRAKAQPLGVRIKHVNAAYPELQVDTLEEVALNALAFCRSRFSPPFIIEDSGLFVEELNGFPGPYSAYVYKTIGIDGVLRLARAGTPARFESVIGCYYHNTKLFKGSVEGVITQPRGHSGFAFDPIFEHEGRTFGEMTREEKNAVSHRSKSAASFLAWASTVL